MKTKAEILGRLLKDKAIDEEELVILLMAETTKYIPMPYPVYPVINPQPYFQPPYNPITPFSPYVVTC